MQIVIVEKHLQVLLGTLAHDVIYNSKFMRFREKGLLFYKDLT